MIYQIFRNNIEIVQVKPLNNSELSQKKQQEDLIRLNFELSTYVDLKIGDYIGYEQTGQIYTLNKPPRVIESPKKYQYECIFEGAIHSLKKTKVFLETPKISGGNYRDYKFPLTGNAQTFLQFIVDNLNRNEGGYSIGTYKETETQTVTFNNWNAYEAIESISSLLNFSWYLDGKTLHFDEKGFDSTQLFRVGRKSGLISLTRTRIESEDVETVVYGYGSTQNLPARSGNEPTYDSELLTENRLSFIGVDGESKLEKNTDLFGSIEVVKEFNSIKPEYVGQVTSVDENNVQIFFDTNVDFDIEQYKLSGIKPKINFLNGSLIGLNFDITYDHSTNQFLLDLYSDESGSYPNNILKPAVGDNYIIFDIGMPSTYITDAQQRLKDATQEYLDEVSSVREFFEAVLDDEYIARLDITLSLGDLVRIVSSTFQIDNLYEIKELVQNINNPEVYKIKFGDVLPRNLLATLKNSNFVTQQEIFNIQSNTYSTTQINNQVTNIVGTETAWESL